MILTMLLKGIAGMENLQQQERFEQLSLGESRITDSSSENYIDVKLH